jgi:hypothetical protein
MLNIESQKNKCSDSVSTAVNTFNTGFSGSHSVYEQYFSNMSFYFYYYLHFALLYIGLFLSFLLALL